MFKTLSKWSLRKRKPVCSNRFKQMTAAQSPVTSLTPSEAVKYRCRWTRCPSSQPISQQSVSKEQRSISRHKSSSSCPNTWPCSTKWRASVVMCPRMLWAVCLTRTPWPRSLAYLPSHPPFTTGSSVRICVVAISTVVWLHLQTRKPSKSLILSHSRGQCMVMPRNAK